MYLFVMGQKMLKSCLVQFKLGNKMKIKEQNYTCVVFFTVSSLLQSSVECQGFLAAA